MVKIKPFDVEQWMDEHELKAAYNIAETCSDSISVDQLVSLDSKNPSAKDDLFKKLTSTRLTYGHIRGSPELRSKIAGLYETSLQETNILVTPGAIAANFLLFYALVGPGDHVICVHPCYQQLYAVPESLGADVSLWKLKEEDGWKIDVGELEALIRPNTKLIIINNPNNPTGITYDKSTLSAIADIAKNNSNIPILSDEVYRPLFHSTTPPPSLHDIYENAIVTGSFSKAYALAGIRLGWVASRNTKLVEAAAVARDYNTISVSALDDAVGAYALGVPELMERNTALARTNLPILDAFVNKYAKYCEYVKPTAGTTAFIKFKVDDVKFCSTLQEKTGVMFVPGGLCFGVEEGEFRGYVRVGYCCATDVLKAGLEKAGTFLEGEEFAALLREENVAGGGGAVEDTSSGGLLSAESPERPRYHQRAFSYDTRHPLTSTLDAEDEEFKPVGADVPPKVERTMGLTDEDASDTPPVRRDSTPSPTWTRSTPARKPTATYGVDPITGQVDPAAGLLDQSSSRRPSQVPAEVYEQADR